MTIQDYLALPEPLVNAEVQRAIAEVLWPGPWDHDQWVGWDYAGPCKRCGSTNRLVACAIPPPIADPIEVVARKLRDKVQGDAWRRFWTAVDTLYPEEEIEDKFSLWIAKDTPEQQVLCFLVALGQVGD